MQGFAFIAAIARRFEGDRLHADLKGTGAHRFEGDRLQPVRKCLVINAALAAEGTFSLAHRSSQQTAKALREAGLLAETVNRLGDDFDRVDRDEAAMLATVLEADHAVDLGEQGVVLAAANVDAGLKRGATLANQDGAASDDLAAEALHAEALSVRVATVLGRT